MPSVKNLEKGDIMGISKIVNEEKDKDELCSSSLKEKKGAKGWNCDAVGVRCDFYRERAPSL